MSSLSIHYFCLIEKMKNIFLFTTILNIILSRGKILTTFTQNKHSTINWVTLEDFVFYRSN